MNSQSLIDIFCSQSEYLCTLLEQLSTELMDIRGNLATDASRSATATAHVMMLGFHSKQIAREIERLQVYVAALEATSKDARTASLGS